MKRVRGVDSLGQGLDPKPRLELEFVHALKPAVQLARGSLRNRKAKEKKRAAAYAEWRAERKALDAARADLVARAAVSHMALDEDAPL